MVLPQLALLNHVARNADLAQNASALAAVLRFVKDLLVIAILGGVLLVVAYVTYTLVYVVRPRIPTPFHVAPFEAYMAQHLSEVAARLFMVHDVLDARGEEFVLLHVGNRDYDKLRDCGRRAYETKRQVVDETPPGVQTSCPLRPNLEAIRATLRALRVGETAAFKKRLQMYYRFYSSILRAKSRFCNYFARSDLLHAEEFRGPRGALDMAKVEAFEKEFYRPMDELRANIGVLSAMLTTMCGVYHQKWYDAEMAQFVTNVHLLELLLDKYHRQVVVSYDTRKTSRPFTIQFNLLSIYYGPFAKDCGVRIANVWRTYPEDFERAIIGVLELWNKLGEFIDQIPLMFVAAVDPNISHAMRVSKDKPTHDDANDKLDRELDAYGAAYEVVPA